MHRPLERPDPDELLRRIEDEEGRRARGRLTVFLGAAPGVGKTYGMLLAAREERAARRDVIAGVVETHGRAETDALLEGLETLPRQEIDYRGVRLREFDLDAALVRRPSLILIDELAHTNAPGTRHPKRWQDVEELLDAGIDVYTTLNVQHLAGQNDVVAQITGVVVRETVPDGVIGRATEIRLIDLPVDELLERLREGKVYVPERAGRALENFFRKGNLIALRELALRQTAERVDEQMLAYRRDKGIRGTWPVQGRLLVSVSPSPYSRRLLGSASRMARSLRVPWLAVFVETPAYAGMKTADQAQLRENLRLAEQLGAEVVRLTGTSPSETILSYAMERNVTQILVGKPRFRRLKERISGSFVDELIRASGDIDVFVTSGEEETPPAPQRAAGWAVPLKRARLPGYLVAVLVVAAATGVVRALFGTQSPADAVAVYLLVEVIVSLYLSRGPAIFTAVLSVLAFDFFFIPPYYTFSVHDLHYVATFAVMLLVGAVISTLGQRARSEARLAREGERRTQLLLRLSRELAGTADRGEILRLGAEQLSASLDGEVALFEIDEGRLRELERTGAQPADQVEEEGVVRWVWQNQHEAGLGTGTLPGSAGLYLPLRSANGILAIAALYPRQPETLQDPTGRWLLDALVTQIALALERIRLVEEGSLALLAAEREELRSTLFGAVSHDLRTPLALIRSTAETLQDKTAPMDSATRDSLLASLWEEARHLESRVRNLLDLTRLETGVARVNKEPESMEELFEVSLRAVEDIRGDRDVCVTLAPALPLVMMDALLMAQVVVNLLENALRYAPGPSPIDLRAAMGEGEVLIGVADRGPGIPEEERESVFQRFYRIDRGGRAQGIGLGLAICRAVVRAHGGRIWVEDRDGGGAFFRVALPAAPDDGGFAVEPELERLSDVPISGLEEPSETT